MRSELEDKLIVALMPLIPKKEIQNAKMKITMVLSDYDIEKRETEIVLYQGNKNEQILKKFIATKLAAGLSLRTIKYYKTSIIFALRYIGKPYDEVTPDDLRLYFAKRIQIDKVTKSTADNERRNLSSFYGWLQKEEILLKNPISKVEKIKITKKRKKAYDMLDLEKIRLGCKTNREKAIVEFLASTWCRVSEMCEVKITDIDESRVLVHGKGDKYRDVYLNARAKIAIEVYLAERKDTNPYLFPKAKCAGNIKEMARTGKGKKDWYTDPDLVHPTDPMGMNTAETIIRRIGREAGVEKAHPHRFRRTGATLALRAGMPIQTVSKLLGHNNIETTQIYLDISEDELEQAHKRWVI